MVLKQKRLARWVSAAALIGSVLTLLASLPTTSYADPGLPARGSLPERGTAIPVSSSSPPVSSSSSVESAYIDLHIIGQASNPWTIVQWQDSAGNWHDVEGWRGHPDFTNFKRWWVDKKDFGTGPFRWVVFDHGGKTVLGISDAFSLPTTTSNLQVMLSIQ